MNQIFKIAATGAVLCMLYLYFSKQNKDYAVLISLAGGLLILFMVMDYAAYAIGAITLIAEKYSIDSGGLALVLKVLLTAYTAQFASDLCLDSDMKALSSKIDLAARFVILYITLPTILTLFEYIIKVMQ